MSHIDPNAIFPTVINTVEELKEAIRKIASRFLAIDYNSAKTYTNVSCNARPIVTRAFNAMKKAQQKYNYIANDKPRSRPKTSTEEKAHALEVYRKRINRIEAAALAVIDQNPEILNKEQAPPVSPSPAPQGP